MVVHMHRAAWIRNVGLDTGGLQRGGGTAPLAGLKPGQGAEGFPDADGHEEAEKDGEGAAGSDVARGDVLLAAVQECAVAEGAAEAGHDPGGDENGRDDGLAAVLR